MTRNLVIVESPAKAKTIERYLGPDYTVLASYGHVRDLPEKLGKDQLGVDVEHDFEPEYEIVADRRKQVGAIERAARKADVVYLATDLDREGEAIAWHVSEAIGLDPSKARRVTFSEITGPAIREAFAHPRSIDSHLVDAQQARRVVDRLVGYRLSPLLWRKVRTGLSAGRVQSVAVRLVVDREREIRAFKAREYWTLEAMLASAGGVFPADLVRIDGQKPEIADEATAHRHRDVLSGAHPVVTSVSVKPSRRNPAPPFTTSTLQQEASRKLGFSPKRTMTAAQRLYEGIAMPEGQVGLITYMRTDSVALSRQALAEAKTVIAGRFGARYTVPKGRVYKTKTRGAQEAHEAIRPTSFERDPEAMAAALPRDEGRLYRLIWQRALASQMAAKELETTTIELAAGPYELRASATRTLFDGFAAVYTEGQDDAAAEEAERSLPSLATGDTTDVQSVEAKQHFTEPPPRFTEATLIKALEEHGIGRPSTYAATISTILDRGYVIVRERRLQPEPVGEIVTDLLVGHFGELVDLEFTARMEEDLDEVASGKREWVPLVRAFYEPFGALVDRKTTEILPGEFRTLPSDQFCSEGHPMVIRLGRNGAFLGCSLYPEHKETRPLPDEGRNGTEPADGTAAEGAKSLPGVGETCPECGATEGGKLVARTGRFGAFVGCERYPDCRYIHKTGPPPPDPLAFEVTCPRCGQGHLLTRRARRSGSLFWGCSRYPKCEFTTSREPLGAVHDADGGVVARDGETGAICLTCGATIEVPAAGITPGAKLAGGPPNPEALARQSRRGRPAAGGRGAASGRSRAGGSANPAGGRTRATRRGRSTERTPGA